MARVFKNHVHYVDPETGERTLFEPGDECPRELLSIVDSNNLTDPEEVEAEKELERRGVVSYGRMGKEELIALCADRGLDVTGDKKKLVARLEAHDAALS